MVIRGGGITCGSKKYQLKLFNSISQDCGKQYKIPFSCNLEKKLLESRREERRYQKEMSLFYGINVSHGMLIE